MKALHVKKQKKESFSMPYLKRIAGVWVGVSFSDVFISQNDFLFFRLAQILLYVELTAVSSSFKRKRLYNCMFKVQ